jgi:hypothetical protein
MNHTEGPVHGGSNKDVSLLAVCCLYKIIQETACELIPGAFISLPTGKRKLCRHEHR